MIQRGKGAQRCIRLTAGNVRKTLIPSRRWPGWHVPKNLAPQLCVAGFHQLCPYVGRNLAQGFWKSNREILSGNISKRMAWASIQCRHCRFDQFNCPASRFRESFSGGANFGGTGFFLWVDESSVAQKTDCGLLIVACSSEVPGGHWVATIER